MNQANAEIVELVPVQAGEVSWDRARKLWDDAKNKARLSGDALVELGRTLAALRKEYAAAGAGGGGDRKSAQYKITSNRGVGGDSPKLNQKGWEKKVLEETGIPAWTARRIIEDSQYAMMLREVAADEQLIRYPDSKRQIVEVEPTEAMRAVARKLLPDVELGLVKPARAWAGVMGEGTRQAGGPARAAVDN